ncbi:MAG TPA: class I SAM-dependent methyltransferase [Desulfosarcina sp.]|nr:class I SAM-dependent methyltransferase [Desulfosarcina sp.]
MSADTPTFQEKMIAILNHGALNLAMGLGYRLGLFEVMDAERRPRTAAHIAAEAGLDPRYVEEWLGVMVCGRIVELVAGDDGAPRFLLPEAHGNVLARRAGSDNLGVYTQEIPLLTACAMTAVLKGFASGEGIPYANYPEFHDFMAQLGDAKHRRVLVETFLPSVDDGRMVEALRHGIDVCDLGCAQGVATILMARAFPQSRFTGIDISVEALDAARREARHSGMGNVRFECRDAVELSRSDDLAGTFDYVTAFDAIHDQTRPMQALNGVHALLKANGAFSMIDIAADSHMDGNRSHPMGPFLYAVSLMHCMPVGLVEGGAGLGMMWGRQLAERMLTRAGFRQVTVAEIPGDPFNLHFFCRP